MWNDILSEYVSYSMLFGEVYVLMCDIFQLCEVLMLVLLWRRLKILVMLKRLDNFMKNLKSKNFFRYLRKMFWKTT